MKNLLLPLLVILTINPLLSQVNFEKEIIQLPGSKTDFEAVEIADINNDGLNDIIVGSGYYFDELYDYSVFIYKQNADKKFSNPIQLKYKESYPGITDLEVGDFNNDNLKDIAIARVDSVCIAFQTVNGGFTPFKGIAKINAHSGIKCGDLNNDGLTDIVTSEGSKYSIHYQLPTGGFMTSLVSHINQYCTQMDIGDLNNDGLNDLVKIYGQKIEIQYQEAGKGITGNVSQIITADFDRNFEGISIGDINDDNKNDIVVTYGGNKGRISIFYQEDDGKFNFEHVKTISTYDIPTPVIIADINCDGKKDITIGHSGWDHVSVFTQNDTTGLDEYLKFRSIYYYTKFSMAVGDINNDQRPDIVSVAQNASISILYNKTVPSTFDSIKTEIKNLTVINEIVDSVSYEYVSYPDTSTTCSRNRFFQYKKTRTFSNDHYSGDSLFIRFGNMCSTYCDTLFVPFTYLKSNLLDSTITVSVVYLDSLGTDQRQIYAPANGQTQTIQIKANICWEVFTDQDWVTPSVFSGEDNHLLGLQIAKNPGVKSRTATVTIKAAQVPDVVITIEQSAAEPYLKISTTSVIISETINNQACFEIESNTDWNIYRNVEWINLDKTVGSDNEIICFSCQSNETESDRNGYIFISTNNWYYYRELIVYQLRKSPSAVDDITENELIYCPVPVIDKLNIKSALQEANYEIVNLQGQVIASGILLDYTAVIDLSGATKGIYFLRLFDKNKTITKRIIKQ